MTNASDVTGLMKGLPFEFVRELGRGGMGVVIEAVDPRTRQTCAVKLILDPDAPADLAARMRLELEMLARGKSAHFVGFLGAGHMPNGAPWYAMEKLVGRTLAAELAEKKNLPVRDVLLLGIQLFDGLAAAHALGVVHRDIKPENIFLCDGSNPRLLRVLDFGIAKVVNPQEGGPAPLAIPTAAGVIVASLRWAAPEIVSPVKPIDGRVDLYSAGLVLWSCLAGTIPFPEAQSLATLCTAQLREDLPKLQDVFKGGDYGALDTIIEGITRKDPEKRTRSAVDVAAELRHVLRERFAEELPPVPIGGAPRLVQRGQAPAPTPALAPAAAPAPPRVDPPRATPDAGVRGFGFPELQTGSTFEKRYEIVGHLGQGGMGTVYRAKHLFLGRDLALKLIPLEGRAMGVDMRVQFASEMELLAKVDHPNIVKVYDGGVTDGNIAYIVMELLDGDSLRKGLVSGRPLDDALACRTIQQIAEGLTGLHAVPVLHRDIKPENVMICRDGAVKIVDFGLARVRTNSKYVTRNPLAMGTLHYMPREQLLNEPLDESVDVFALGLVMFECLVGRNPRAVEPGVYQSATDAIASVVRGMPVQPLALRRPDLPPELLELYQRAVDVDPSKRPKAAEIAKKFISFQQWALEKTQRQSAPSGWSNAYGISSQGAATDPRQSGGAFGSPPAGVAAKGTHLLADGRMPISAAHSGAGGASTIAHAVTGIPGATPTGGTSYVSSPVRSEPTQIGPPVFPAAPTPATKLDITPSGATLPSGAVAANTSRGKGGFAKVGYGLVAVLAVAAGLLGLELARPGTLMPAAPTSTPAKPTGTVNPPPPPQPQPTASIAETNAPATAAPSVTASATTAAPTASIAATSTATAGSPPIAPPPGGQVRPPPPGVLPANGRNGVVDTWK